MPLLPTNETVAIAWLSTLVPGLTPAMVASSLPSPDAWPQAGFVTVPSVVGGSPAIDLPIAQPVVNVNAWWNSNGIGETSIKPAWGKAGAIVNEITWQTHDVPLDQRLTIPGGLEYFEVMVYEVTVVTEPRKIEGDPSGYARFSLDLLLRWSPIR